MRWRRKAFSQLLVPRAFSDPERRNATIDHVFTFGKVLQEFWDWEVFLFFLAHILYRAKTTVLPTPPPPPVFSLWPINDRVTVADIACLRMASVVQFANRPQYGKEAGEEKKRLYGK